MIQPPTLGSRPRASWARQITDAANMAAPIGASSMLMRSGAYGTGCEPLPPNKRDRRGAAAAIPPGCWIIVASDATPPVYTLANQYYKRGAVVCAANVSTTLNSLVQNGLLFIALSIDATTTAASPVSIVGYTSFQTMADASEALQTAIIPLYQLDSDYHIICDFRNIPEVQMAEVF